MGVQGNRALAFTWAPGGARRLPLDNRPGSGA